MAGVFPALKRINVEVGFKGRVALAVETGVAEFVAVVEVRERVFLVDEGFRVVVAACAELAEFGYAGEEGAVGFEESSVGEAVVAEQAFVSRSKVLFSVEGLFAFEVAVGVSIDACALSRNKELICVCSVLQIIAKKVLA